jgi:hypothetical protein
LKDNGLDGSPSVKYLKATSLVPISIDPLKVLNPVFLIKSDLKFGNSLTDLRYIFAYSRFLGYEYLVLIF